MNVSVCNARWSRTTGVAVLSFSGTRQYNVEALGKVQLDSYRNNARDYRVQDSDL